jgi:two-component system nitrate/nitrite response regulator NarL
MRHAPTPNGDGAAPLRVVIADDHPLFRAGIVRALEGDRRFVVVGEAGDGPTAERMIREADPDIALLDLRMPGADGIELLARLRHREPPVAVVVLTASLVVIIAAEVLRRRADARLEAA